ncbi:hypothetical protein [Candidatus Uabimicrobium amorphum]|uniref:Uncharacterized protein n=1 Tax=Uabimicrobium amorphum TaxID=2596890 RepID=A0A5S9F2R0_UABAM|nr:hypothetical protein [Candidatus Uabimicrobium amorphum]BBM82624.1 hypothetical protein UABAM_00967 [Candidatus Uabimicrobium amorphum]
MKMNKKIIVASSCVILFAVVFVFYISIKFSKKDLRMITYEVTTFKKIKNALAKKNDKIEKLKGKNKIPSVKYETQKIKYTTQDKILMEKIIDVLNASSPGRNHKCASLAKITLYYASKKIVIDCLSGHNSGYYEYRYNGWLYKMNEAKFFALRDAMEKNF